MIDYKPKKANLIVDVLSHKIELAAISQSTLLLEEHIRRAMFHGSQA